MFRNLLRGVFCAVLSFAFVAGITGCKGESEGTAEEMGKKVDEAGEAATQAVEDAGDKLGETANDLTGGGG